MALTGCCFRSKMCPGLLQVRLEVNAVYPGSALVSLAEHRNKVSIMSKQA